MNSNKAKAFISSNLKLLSLSIIIGLFACAISIFAFSSPGSNQPPNGTPTFWFLNGASMYYSGGNVGVGTSSPTIGKLSVNGVGVAGGFNQNWNISTILDLDASANSTNEAIRMLSYSSTAAWGIIAGATNGGLYFATSSINGSGTPGVVLAMLNNGNVGIGTTAPGYTLDVNGTIGGSAFTWTTAGLAGANSWSITGGRFTKYIKMGKTVCVTFSLNRGAAIGSGAALTGLPIPSTSVYFGAYGYYGGYQGVGMYIDTSGALIIESVTGGNTQWVQGNVCYESAS